MNAISATHRNAIRFIAENSRPACLRRQQQEADVPVQVEEGDVHAAEIVRTHDAMLPVEYGRDDADSAVGDQSEFAEVCDQKQKPDRGDVEC